MMGPAGTEKPITRTIEVPGNTPSEVRVAITKGHMAGRLIPERLPASAVQKASSILSDHDIVLDPFRGIWVTCGGDRVQVVIKH